MGQYTIITVEHRRELAREYVTLNGKPAHVVGVLNDYATVRATDGESYEWSWVAVERIIRQRGGRFNS